MFGLASEAAASSLNPTFLWSSLYLSVRGALAHDLGPIGVKKSSALKLLPRALPGRIFCGTYAEVSNFCLWS
jgi:hypothetical protein